MIRTKIQIRFSDVDMAGHVHNAAYFQFFELGRIDFFNQKVLDGGSWDWEKKSLIVARNEINYKLPIQFEDEVHVETNFESAGNSSIVLSYEVFKNGQNCANGKSILVCFDYELNQKILVPADWRAKFESN